MPGGTRRLEIEYHITTTTADQQAEAFNQRQAAREKRALTDAEVAEKAKARLVQQTNQERIAAEARRIAEEESNAKKSGGLLDWLIGKEKDKTRSIQDSTGAVGKFAAGMAALQALAPVASTFAEHFSKIRTDAFKAAEEVMRMRGAVRELQALRGEMGQTGGGVSHVFDIARQTLQSPEQVQQMEAAGLGVGELALKTDKDRAEFEKAMVAAGKFQTLEGGSSSAYGQMMGQIALQSRGSINAAEMEARANRLFKIQQPGGFRNMESALQQYSGLNALVMNDVYTPEEAMGLASAFSVSSPNEAGTKAEQFTRAVMAGRIRNRGMAVSKDVDLEKSAEYFKEIGIGEQDSAIARGKKIADDLARQKAGSEAKGQKFNATEYLMLHGFANQQDALAIMDFAGLRNSGRLEKIEEAQNAPLEMGAISRRFDDRLKRDNFLKGRQVELAEQAATAKQGIEEEPLILAQRAAFARLKAQGKISGTFEEWQSKGFLQRGSEDLFFGGYHHQVNAEASRTLSAERERLGLSQYSGIRLPFVQEDETATMRRSAREIQSAGGDVTRGVSDDLKDTTRAVRELTAELKKQAGPPIGPPPPMPGRPAPQAARVQ